MPQLAYPALASCRRDMHARASSEALATAGWSWYLARACSAMPVMSGSDTPSPLPAAAVPPKRLQPPSGSWQSRMRSMYSWRVAWVAASGFSGMG